MDIEKLRHLVDELLNERDQRMDDLFNRLQVLSKDLEEVKQFLEKEND
tara:strand:- start:1471 stop:1614 length:144 start_codon:yes stop_codon:yes gene_type:complete